MIENSIVYRKMKKYNFFRLAKAEGSLIWDRDGRRFIDFTSGWNVTNLGWNHPEVKEAVIAQTKKNVQGLLWGSDLIQEQYAAKLTAALPSKLDACVKTTGGTEAIESSIKIARAATGRQKIIGFKNSYHGQLFAALALGYPQKSVEKIAPLVPDFVQLDFPNNTQDIKKFRKFGNILEETLEQRDIAAVVTEPGIITGWGDTRIAHPGFLKILREKTQKYGTLLIIDEVGTGFSRTGKLFAIEHEKITPDMIVLAKAISNGASAIGTVVGNSEMFQSVVDDVILVSTFGWTPIACAAALKTLEIHQREKTWEQAAIKGEYIMNKLKPFLGGSIVHLRGQGLEIGLGVKNDETARKIVDQAHKKGLHIVMGGKNNIQLMPPLNISQELLDEGLDIIINILSKNK